MNSSSSTPGYHLAARYSIIAALVCFAGNCVANQIAWRQGLSGANWFRMTVNVATAALVLSGVFAGLYGLIVALRRKASDSAGIAVIGLGLQIGIIALTIWGLWMVTKARRELELRNQSGQPAKISQTRNSRRTLHAGRSASVSSQAPHTGKDSLDHGVIHD